MVDEEQIMYLALCGIVCVLIMVSAGSYDYLAIPVLGLGLIALLVILLIEFADFLVFPFFTTVLGIKIVPAKNYYIPSGQNAVIKITNGLYYATGYLTGNLFNYIFKAEEVTEEDTALASSMDRWERIIMNVNFPFKFSIVAMAQEIQKYRDTLEGERGLLQFELGKELNNATPNPINIQEIQKKINIVEAKMNRIGAGEKPMNSLIYIESTAVGVSEKEALDILDTQMNQLQTVFNVFDLSIARVTGREVYSLFKFNYKLPDLDTVMAMFQLQK